MNRKKKNLFANCVIILCLAVTAALTASIVWEYRRLDTVIPSDVLKELVRFWGGELLIIMLRQVLGSDFIKKIRPTSSATSYEEESI